ncbi:HI1506-related protein [Ferrimonas balearica]|uniref:HI1506-related protein n=1 Tax=Ferrimonas balearica TaxID=44012 RepID=UPI001C98C861|nr:HI1506-related protein [Ferrimonas balearica]MBY6223563.1 hypothetical protein [Ferrimonas balearica]
MTQSKTMRVVCLAHTGYRRAGLAFEKGDNTLDATGLTEAQLAQITADPRLRLEGQGDSVSAVSGAAISSAPALTLAQALAQLQPDNPDHFTQSGKPKTEALEALVKQPVSAKARDSVWAEYQAANAAQGED